MHGFEEFFIFPRLNTEYVASPRIFHYPGAEQEVSSPTSTSKHLSELPVNLPNTVLDEEAMEERKSELEDRSRVGYGLNFPSLKIFKGPKERRGAQGTHDGGVHGFRRAGTADLGRAVPISKGGAERRNLGKMITNLKKIKKSSTFVVGEYTVQESEKGSHEIDLEKVVLDQEEKNLRSEIDRLSQDYVREIFLSQSLTPEQLQNFSWILRN